MHSIHTSYVPWFARHQSRIYAVQSYTARIVRQAPKEWEGPRGVLWILLKIPYGITEAGRQWAQLF